jgi:hypothetical protein
MERLDQLFSQADVPPGELPLGFRRPGAAVERRTTNEPQGQNYYVVPRRPELTTALKKASGQIHVLFRKKSPRAIGTIKLPERQINGPNYTPPIILRAVSYRKEMAEGTGLEPA